MKIILSLRIGVVFLLFVLIVACNQQAGNANKSVKSISVNADSLLLDSLSNQLLKSPNSAALYEQRSLVYEKMGKLTLSIEDLAEASRLDTLNVDYMVRLSDKYLQFGQSQVTRELLNNAIAIEPHNVEVLYRLGSLYFYVQDYKKSVSYLQQAKKADPFYAPVYFTYAMIYKEKGDTLNAIEQLQIAVEREAKYYDAYILLGALYSGLGDSLAVDYYRNALDILPGSYEAAYGIAMFYQLNDKPELAIQQYNLMLVGNRDNSAHVYFNLGYIEMIFYNEFETAINYFDSSINIQKNYAAAYSNKAYCYEQLQKIDSARNNYGKALQIMPDLEVARLGLNRVTNN